MIRSKRDVIALLMRTIKIMLLPPYPNPAPVGKIVLHVEKMSRLFYIFENKIFSINFPYTVIEGDGVLLFRSTHHSEINSAVTSNVLSVVETFNALDNREVFHFAEPISDICQSDDEFWSLFRELLLYEDGYIRFDHDEKNAKEKLHPLDHLDIFYSSSSTFKIGLHENSSHEHLLDLLDRNTECHFLTKIVK